jgi:hypothetical protein
MHSKIRAIVRRSVALTAAGAALTTLGAANSQATPVRGAQPVERQQLASAVLGQDYKITLTALRSTDDEYAASVRMRVYEMEGGEWKETDQAAVGERGGWFWYPLTGPRAVCKFSVAGTNPAPIEVSLLITPSIGCSPAAAFMIKDGRIQTA